MMTRLVSALEELEALAAEYHHVLEEHRRAGPEGTVRRHLHDRLARLEEEFERLLAEWMPEDGDRMAWRTHLHAGGPAPREPGGTSRALVFKGRSDSGSVLEIRERPDGDYDVVVDGAEVERIAGAPDFAGEVRHVFRLDALEFREIFGVPAPALAALRAHVEEPVGQPPWQQAHALLEDGLVDRTFSLTPRGRRALASRP